MKKEIYWLILFMFVLPLGILSCSSDDDNSPSFSDVKLHNGEKYLISGGEGAKWESDNILVASVSDNTVYGHCIGTTTISSELGKFNVTVEPKYNNVIMPSKNYGASMSTIKSEMSRYNLLRTTDTGLMYEAPSPSQHFIYLFENNRMTSSAITCTASNFNTIADYMKERYFFVNLSSSSASKDEIIGMTSDKKEACMVSYSTSGGYFLFLFMPVDNSTRGIGNAKLSEKYKAFISNSINSMER